ncbi:MAG: hypothetical protein COA94_04770 [Rickettsiales bacterium]|nr:MAG: hypothetical protein COA94_04770 [Rickettsiales bacterium]
MAEEIKNEDVFKEFTNKMVGAIDALGERIGTIETTVGAQSTSLQAIQDNAVAPAPIIKDEETVSLAEMDLESMSRGDFARAITAAVVSSMREEFKPINEQVGTLQNSNETQQLRTEFNDVANKHTDFGSYKDIMLGMVETHSHLSVQEMYTIAKANNPDIATQAASAEAEANPPANKGDAFGGLTPTSGSTIQNKGEANTTDAAEEAWGETMTDTPESAVG